VRALLLILPFLVAGKAVGDEGIPASLTGAKGDPARGRAIVARHTWESVARRFGVLYRRAAGRPLSAADEALVATGAAV